MNRKQRRTALLVGGAALLWASWSRAAGRGQVFLGPVSVTSEKVNFDAQTQTAIQRLTLSLTRMRQVCGYDPNTLASKKPSSPDQDFCEQTMALARQVAGSTNGLVPAPMTEEKMYRLALTLPGSSLNAVNAQLYALLGIDPRADNQPTVPLTPAIESKARELIAKWRPYSKEAVDNLFAQLDLARELGGAA